MTEDVPYRRPLNKRWRIVALSIMAILIALLLISPMITQARSELAPAGKSVQAPSTQPECALLDDPSARGLMSAMFEIKLLNACGRQNEAGSQMSQRGIDTLLSNPFVGLDVAVNNPAGDSGSSTTQSETSLALNENTGTLCSGYNDSYHGVVQGQGYTGFSRSIDGGATFTDRGPIGSASFGDPSVIWRKADGNFYIATIHSSGMGLWRSTDDCQTFVFVGNPHVGGGDDKELINVDNNPASPYYGRIYMVWTDFNAGARIYSIYSDNQTTWTAPIALSADGASVQGAWPVVAPNNDVYVAWVRWNPYPTGPIDIEIARSTNGGSSYSLVTNPLTGGVNPRDNAATNFCGRPALNGNVRYLPSPQITVSPNGDLHVVYTRDPDAFNSGDVVNVYYRRSTDDGATWGPEILVNDDATTRDNYFPTISSGPSGRIVSTWYDRRLDSNNYLYDYYMRVSHDGGNTWEASKRVSDVSSPVYIDPNLNTCYHGDYDQQLQDSAQVYIQWSDDRRTFNGHNDPDVYFDVDPFAPDFTLDASPDSQSVCAPSDAVYTVTIGQILGYTDQVTLSASGNPAGTTTLFSINPVTPPGVSLLNIGNTGGASAGSYTIQITGTAVTSTHTTDVNLNLYTATPGSVSLISPANGATNISLAPTLTWTAASQAASYEVQVATDAGFTNVVYSNTSAGTSHTLTSPLAPLTLYFWRVRPVNTCGLGSYSAAFSFTTADIPPILLVDDDDNAPDVRAYYTDALDAVGAGYDIWDTQNSDNEPTSNDLTPYTLVIWFTGVEFGGFAGPGGAGEAALSSWLNGGNCLFISSQDYLYDRGQTPFIDTYLGVATYTSDVAQNNVTGQGIVFGGYGPYSLSYPFTNYSDYIAPDGDAEVAFLGDAFLPEAAVDKDGGAYKTTFWGFPFEAVSNANDRADLMTQVINWCGGGVTVGTLAGTVTDANGGGGIPNAIITADNGSLVRTTTTNASGGYSLNLATGVYEVTASKANYVSQTVSGVEINEGDTTVVDFELEGSSLDYSPPNIEEFMEIGDIVTNSVTINATGPLPVDFSVSFGSFGGPSLQIPASPVHIPASNGNFPRGTAAPSTGPAPKSDRPGQGDSTIVLPGGAVAYGLQIDLNTFAFDLSSFNTNDPASLNVIGSTGADLLPGGDFINGDFSKMYALDYDAGQLISVDTATGAVTVIGSSFPTGAHSWTGMAGDPTDGTLYAASCDITQSAIYTIDTNTGTASLVGTSFDAPCLIGIAIDASGQMYGFDIVTDALYSVDKTTGAATTIGSLGYDANFSQGMDFDEATGILYIAAYNNGTGSGELRVADTSTGNTTLIGPFGGTGLVEMNTMAVATGGVSSNWVYAVPNSGTVPANGSTNIDVVFDARSLYQVGDYTAEMKFSGTFVNNVPPMPLTMHLSCPSCGFLDGSVFDADTGDPLAASVHITGPNNFDVTLNGETYALAVQPGAYNIDVSASGYIPDSAQVNVNVGQTVTTDFYLIPDVAVLDYAPPAIEEFMEIGDIVTNTVYVTNTGAHQLDYSVHIGNYGGPSLGYSDGNFAHGAAAPSFGPAPHSGAPAGIGGNNLFPLAGGALAYGLQIDLNTFAFDLSSFTTNDPANLNVIGSTGGDLLVGGDFLNGDFSVLYALDYDANMFVAIDTATGAVTPIGSSFPTGGQAWTGLANDPTSGQMYASSCDITQTAIYTIDVTTGAANLIGTTFDAPCLIGIAINTAGEMYGHDIVTDSLYRVDKTNGAATMIGSLGFDANFSQGMDFDEETGILYIAAYNNSTGSGELRVADTTTGNTTLVGPFAGTGLVEMNSMAVATGGAGANQWASAVPDSGSIPPYSSGTFEVVFDARSMVQTGDFTAQLTFSGNFVNSVAPMDLTMHLSCATCGFLDGSVTDAGSGDPLNAEIHVTGPNGFDVTLHDDVYDLAVQPGSYDFTVSANGYVSQSATVVAVQGATVTTDFALLPAAATLTYSPDLIEETVAWGDVVNNTLTINNIGTIAFDFSLADYQTGSPFGLEAAQQPTTACPPDSFGYTCIDSNEPGGPTYNWVEIAPPAGGTGTLINFPSSLDDDYYWPITLPFNFRFYGVDYTDIAVATNGTIYFQNAYLGFGNSPIPSSTGYGVDTYIGGLWDDLYITPGAVYYQIEPTRIIVEHYQTSVCCVSPDSATWEMILSNDGNILFQYQDVTFGTGNDNGGSATVGIQGDAVTGVQYSYLSPVLTSELAICFPYPGSGDPTCGGLEDAAWATESPDAGTVDPGGSTDVTVTFDSTVITTTGTYTATLIFDGTFENQVAPATLVMHVVDPAPAITLEKTVSTDGSCGTTNEVTAAWGSDVTYCYTVTNSGNTMLNTHTLTDDQLGTLLNGAAYDLQPGDSYAYLTTITLTPPPPPFPSVLTNCATWVATRDALTATSNESCATVNITAPTDVSLTGFGSVAAGIPALWLAATLVLVAGLALVMRRKVAR